MTILAAVSEVEAITFASRLRDLRSRLGLTQVQMAELLGTSFASVNRWENGQTRPSRMAWDLLRRTEERTLALSPAEDARARASADTIDFLAPPEHVHLVAEGERLSFGHLFNPAFATEISQIDPLPHQRIAVYEHMLPQPRLRFLLADDAGAGKTIMAGLYIREMLARRLIRRVLIVPPAGLVGNWERELRSLFSLDVPHRRGQRRQARQSLRRRRQRPASSSAWTRWPATAMFARLQEAAVVALRPRDLRRGHKLSADREPDLTRPQDRPLPAGRGAGRRAASSTRGGACAGAPTTCCC